MASSIAQLRPVNPLLAMRFFPANLQLEAVRLLNAFLAARNGPQQRRLLGRRSVSPSHTHQRRPQLAKQDLATAIGSYAGPAYRPADVRPQGPARRLLRRRLLNAVTDLYNVVSDGGSHSSDEANANASGPVKMEPEPDQLAPPPPQTLPTPSTSSPIASSTPPMIPPPAVMVLYTEVIDHSSFQYTALLDTIADCIHHEMTTRLQARLPLNTARNRVRR